MHSEKTSLLLVPNGMAQKPTKCKWMSFWSLLVVLALGGSAYYYGSPLSHKPRTMDSHNGPVNWDKWTAMGSTWSKRTNQTSIWKQVWDKQGNRVRIDSILLKSHDVEPQVYEAAEALFAGRYHPNADHHFEGIPMTGLFLPSGIYGLYRGPDGKPACRFYPFSMEVPALNPTQGAQDHGLEYVSAHLTLHYSHLNFPRHDLLEGGQTHIESSDLWTAPFNGHPMAMTVTGNTTWNDKTTLFHMVYHVFRFFSGVANEASLTIPSHVANLCQKHTEREDTSPIWHQEGLFSFY